MKVSDWVDRNFFSLTVFGGNFLAGDVHSSVTMDRHVKSPYSLEAYSGHLLAHLRPGVILSFSYYSNVIFILTDQTSLHGYL